MTEAIIIPCVVDRKYIEEKNLVNLQHKFRAEQPFAHVMFMSPEFHKFAIQSKRVERFVDYVARINFGDDLAADLAIAEAKTFEEELHDFLMDNKLAYGIDNFPRSTREAYHQFYWNLRGDISDAIGNLRQRIRNQRRQVA